MKGIEVGSEKAPKKQEDYIYVQPMASPLYNNVISPVCDKIVEFLPKYLSPNLLTIIGLISISTSFIMLISIGENAKELYLVSAALWFLYGIIDNLDGKQARRLGVSSNSGEFIDHAIDSVATSFVGLAFQYMHNKYLELDLLVVLSYQVPFYFACWFHFQYGKLIIGNSISKTPYFTVDELNLVFIPLFILFEYFFPGLWNLDIHLFGGYVVNNWGIPFNYCCFTYSIFTCLSCIHQCISKSPSNVHLLFIPPTIHIVSKELVKLNIFNTILPFSILCITFIFLKISKLFINKPNRSFFMLICASLIPNLITKLMVSVFEVGQNLTIFIQFLIWSLFVYKFANYLDNPHKNTENKKS